MHALSFFALFTATLPTGSAYIAATGGTCGPTSLATSSCRLATVTCKNLWDPEYGRIFSIDDLQASLKVTEPSGTDLGTVMVQVGAGGTGSGEADTVGTATMQALVDAGRRVIQVQWATGSGNGMWGGSPSSSSYGGDNAPDGPLDLPCRAATLSRAICEDDTLHAAGTPCVWWGQSGGGAAGAYTVMRYGGHAWLDGLVTSGGPPIGMLERGCAGTTYPGWATECATLKTVSPSGGCSYTTGAVSGPFVDAAWNDGRTGCAYQTAANIAGPQGLGYPGLLGGQATRRLAYTTWRGLYGDADSSEAVTLGRAALNRVIDATGSTPAQAVTTGSTPHSVLMTANGGAGVQALILGGTYNGTTYAAIARTRPDLSAQWAPLSLSGLELFLTAESTAHLWQEASGSQPLTHATIATDPIGAVDDMSPSAHTLTAASSGARPTLASGGIVFSSSQLDVANSLDAFRSIYWLGVGGIVARVSFASDGAAGCLLDSNGAATGSSGLLLERTAGNKLRIQVTKGSGSAVYDYTTTVSALAADGEQTLAVVFGAAGGGTIRWGSTVEAFTRTSAPSGTGQAATNLAIGRRAAGTNALAGTIRHLAILSRAPTAAEVASLGSWAPTRSSAALVSWVGPDAGYFTGLSHWVDLTDSTSVFSDTAATTPIAADGTVAVARSPKDRDGHLARDYSQATAGSRPTWLGGGQAGLGASFDGSDDFLGLAANWPATGAATMVVVVRQDDATFGSALAGGTTGNDNYEWLGGPSYTNWSSYATGASPTEMSAPLRSASVGSWNIIEIVRDGPTWTLSTSGAGTATYTEPATWVRRWLGRYDTYRLKGAVRAMLVWRAALTSTQLGQVRTHLCGRFSGAC